MASEDEIPTPDFRKPVSQRDSFSDESADYNQTPPEAPTPSGGTFVSGYVPKKAEDHQRRVPNVPFEVPVSKKNRIVPRYEVEGTPAPADNTSANASGNSGGGGGGGGSPDPSVLVQLQVLQSQIDGFQITAECDADGTLTVEWSFGGDDPGP